MVAMFAAFVLLVLGTIVCLATIVPTGAGLFPRRANRAGKPVASRPTFAVLIPAHNEETILPAALRSLAALDYAPERVRVYVVADNCTDNTARIAQAAGAVCVVRNDPEKRGKGYALAKGLERVKADAPDIVLIFDADCELSPNTLQELDQLFATGADAVQCALISRNVDDGPTGYVAAVGAAVDEVVATGLDRLGLSVPLRGTGMAFRWHVLEAVPWSAFGVVEDAEYARTLHAAGVRVRHCGTARISNDAPANLTDFQRQRRRWRLAGVLTSKPLALGVSAIAITAGIATGFVWWPLLILAFTFAVYLRAVLVVGLTWKRCGLLLCSPAIVLRLAGVTLAGVVKRQPTTWDRTPRPGERPHQHAA